MAVGSTRMQPPSGRGHAQGGGGFTKLTQPDSNELSEFPLEFSASQ